MQKKDNYKTTTISVILVLLFVKLFGFVKQAVIAANFGTNTSMDLFLTASEFIQHFASAIFSALSISLLALYIEEKRNKNNSANKLMSNAMILFIPLSALLVIIFWLFDLPIAKILAPGLKLEQHFLLAKYIRIISLVLINACVSTVFSAILEGEKKFLCVKFSGLILSTTTILSCFFFKNSIGLDALIIGLLAYYVIESVFFYIFVRKAFSFHPERPWKDNRIRKLIKLSIPVYIGNAGIQLTSVVDKAIASSLPEGAISSLSYSYYLNSTIHSILIGSLCTVLFSYFASYVAEKALDKVQQVLHDTLTMSMAIMVPISLLCILLSKEIVTIIYGRGQFDSNSILTTSQALAGYAAGFVPLAIRDILIRAHYSFKDTRHPAVNSMVGVISNIFTSIILSRKFGIIGITAASSVSCCITALLSYHTLKKHLAMNHMRIFWSNVLKIMLSASISLILFIIIRNFVSGINIYIQLILLGGFFTLIYLMFLVIFKCGNIYQIILKKFLRRDSH